MSLGSASLEVLVKTEDVRRAKADLDRLADSGKNVDAAVRVTESRMKILDAAARKTSTELRRMREVARASGDGTKEFSAEILKTTRAVRSAEAAIISIGRALQRMRADQSATAASSRNLHASVQSLNGSLGSVRGLLASFGVGLAARGLVQIGNEFQRVRQTLVATFGDVKTAEREFTYLMATANRLGISFSAISDSYAQMAAATKGTALEGERMRDVFEAVAETSSVMRFSVENTRGIIKAFEQMMSKGTVQAEELRNQLGDRLPGAFGLFVRAQFGANEATQEMRAQFNKMMKEGQIVASDILPKVAAELRKTFGPGLAQATQSAQAELARMDNAFKALLLRGWDAGFEQAVKNLAMTLRSLFENENAIRFIESFSKATVAVTQVIYDFRGVLVPAIAALAAFVAVFSAGTVLSSLARVFSFSKGMVGTLSALSAAAVAAAAAFGFMGGKSTQAAGDQTKFAKASGEAASQLAQLQQLTGSTGSSTLFGGIGDDALNATTGMYQYAAAVEAVRGAQEGLSAATQRVGSAVSSVDWGLLASAAIGGASVFGMARGRVGEMSAKVGAKASGFPGMVGAAVGGLASVMPANARTGAVDGYAKGAASMSKMSDHAIKAGAAIRALSQEQQYAGTMSAKLGASFASLVSAFGRATSSAGVLGVAVGGLRGLLSGIFALMGGWPGLVVGAIAAATVALVQFEQKRKEALNISEESKNLAQFYKDLALVDKNPVAAQNADQINELARARQDLLEQERKNNEARKNLIKDYEDSYEAHVKRVEFLSKNFVTQTSTDLTAARAAMNEAGRGDLASGLNEAIRSGEYQRALDLMRQFNSEVGNTPAVDRFQDMVEELVNSQNEAQRLRGEISTIEKGIKLAVDAAKAMTDELGREVTKRINVVTLTSEQEKMLEGVRERVADAEKYRGASNQFQRDVIDIREARNQYLGGVGAAHQPPDPRILKEFGELERKAAAEGAAEAGKRTAGRGRSAESRANRTANDRAAAENKIYSVLDPVRAETVRLNEEVRDLTRALTRGGMSSAEASKLVEQYRKVAEQESKLTQEIAKRSAQAEYLDTVGGSGRESELLKIENQMDSFRMQATRAGWSVEEINDAIEKMRSARVEQLTDKFRGLEDQVRDATRAAQDAAIEFSEAFGVDASQARAIFDQVNAIEDLNRERREARQDARESVAAGNDRVQVAQQLETVLRSIDQREKFINATYQQRIELMKDQQRRSQLFASQGLDAQNGINALNFVGGGQRGSNRAAAIFDSNELIASQLLPEGDPQLLRDLPNLLRQFGSAADGTITPWWRKIEAIDAAVKEARANALADFASGTRTDFQLSNDEVGAAVDKGLRDAGTSSLVEINRQRAAEIVDLWRQAGDQLSGLFSSVFSFDSQIKSLRDFGLEFARLVQAMIIEAIRLSVIKPMINAAFSFMGIPTFAQGGVVANAHGNVFRAFAKGMNPLGAYSNSVVTNPTRFAMGGGMQGLMGEAGAEAILPLSRTRNGDLGVRAIGGGGGKITIQNLNVTTVIEGDVNDTNADELSAQIAAKARDAIKGVAAETFMEMSGSDKGVTI